MANGSMVYKHNLLTGLNTDTFQRDIKKFSEPAPLNSCSAGEKYGGLVPWKKDSYTSTLPKVVARKRLSNGKLVEIHRYAPIGSANSEYRYCYIDGVLQGSAFMNASFGIVDDLINKLTSLTGIVCYQIYDIWTVWSGSTNTIRIAYRDINNNFYDSVYNLSKAGVLSIISNTLIYAYGINTQYMAFGYSRNTSSIYWYRDTSAYIHIGSYISSSTNTSKIDVVIDSGSLFFIQTTSNSISSVLYSSTHATSFSLTVLSGYILGKKEDKIAAYCNTKTSSFSPIAYCYYWDGSANYNYNLSTIANCTAWPFGVQFESTGAGTEYLTWYIGTADYAYNMITVPSVPTQTAPIFTAQEFCGSIGSRPNNPQTGEETDGFCFCTSSLIPVAIGFNGIPIVPIGDISDKWNFIYNDYDKTFLTAEVTGYCSAITSYQNSNGDWNILYKKETKIIEFSPGVIWIPGKRTGIIDTNTGYSEPGPLCNNGIVYLSYVYSSMASSEKLIASQSKGKYYSTIDTGGKANLPYYNSLTYAYIISPKTNRGIQAKATNIFDKIFINGISIDNVSDLYVADSSFSVSSSVDYKSLAKSYTQGIYTYFLDDGKITATLGNYWAGEWHLEELMGSEYLCNDYQIGLLTRNGILADSVSKLVDTTGKTFLANCQSYLLYVDTATNKLFKFQTDYILEEIKDCSQLEPIIGAVFDPYENVSYIYTAGSLYSFDGKKIETVQKLFTGMTAIAPDKTITGVYWNSSLTTSTRYTKIAPMPAGWTREIEPLLIATGYYGTDDNGTHTDQSYIIEVRNIGGASSVSLTVGRNYFTEDGLGTYEEQNYTVDTFDSSGYAYIKYNPSAPLSCIGSNLNIASSDDILIGNIYQYYYSDGQAIPSNQ